MVSYAIYVQADSRRGGRCRQRLVARGEAERFWDAVAAVLAEVPDVQPPEACAYGAIYHHRDTRPLRGWRNPAYPHSGLTWTGV